MLVVGAGPVGLTVAHELSRQGIRVRLVDAAIGPATTSRAIATHPRTLETYDQMGVVDRIIARGQMICGFTIFQEGRQLARLDADYSSMPTRFPFTLAIEQTSTEAVLREVLAERGVEAEWGAKVESVDVTDTHVEVALHHSDGSAEQYRVGWLVGCDGGHSTIRKALALPLIGQSNQTWMLADAPLEADLPRDSIYWVRTEDVTLMAVPLRDGNRWRLLDTVDLDQDPTAVRERFARKLSRGLGATVHVGEPTWTSVFTAQQRMVAEMRVGRCLLAGDAAHVHSPASGQGMNAGIQEGVKLAWKLAMVIHGSAREELLDTYSEERVPIGRALLGSTKRATSLVELRSPVVDRVLPVMFGVVRNVGPVRRRIQRKILSGISGLDLTYRDSSLTAGSENGRAAGPRPGQRLAMVTGRYMSSPGWMAVLAELRDPRWLLLIAPGPAASVHDYGALTGVAERNSSWLSVRSICLHARDGIVGPLIDPGGVLVEALGLDRGGWVLVRPDGYLASCATSFDPAKVAEAFASVPLTDQQSALAPSSNESAT